MTETVDEVLKRVFDKFGVGGMRCAVCPGTVKVTVGEDGEVKVENPDCLRISGECLKTETISALRRAKKSVREVGG